MERFKVLNHKIGHRRYLVESLEKVVAAIDDRLVYQVIEVEKTVKVIRMCTHYES